MSKPSGQARSRHRHPRSRPGHQGPAYVRRWKSVVRWARAWWRGQRSRPLARLVSPPLLHGTLWWAWHRPGGQSQPSALQPCCSRPSAMRWAVEWKRRLRPRSRTCDFPSRTAGMIPACAGHPAGLAGADLLAGVELGCLQSTEQGLEGHGDHDGGVHAAGLRERLGGVGLDVLLERQPHPVIRRTSRLGGVAVDRGPVLRGGHREQRLPQHRAVSAGDRELAVALAVTVIGHPQRSRPPRRPVLPSPTASLRGRPRRRGR